MDRPSFLLFVRAGLPVRVPKPRLAGPARVGGQVRQETSCGPCLDCAEWWCAVLPDRRTTPTDRAEIGRISQRSVQRSGRFTRRKAFSEFRVRTRPMARGRSRLTGQGDSRPSVFAEFHRSRCCLRSYYSEIITTGVCTPPNVLFVGGGSLVVRYGDPVCPAIGASNRPVHWNPVGKCLPEPLVALPMKFSKPPRINHRL
jgi:hypothetical protein